MPPTLTRDIKVAADALRAGRLVAMPTETVYGLAAPIADAAAVRAVFELKERPLFDPLIVHVAGEELIDEQAGYGMPKRQAFQLLKAFDQRQGVDEADHAEARADSR